MVENSLKGFRAPENRDKPLTVRDKIIASGLAGALSCWNQPIEYVLNGLRLMRVSEWFVWKCSHKSKLQEDQNH